jgi:hypothetical protein
MCAYGRINQRTFITNGNVGVVNNFVSVNHDKILN